jgi:membrane protease YdiL (CAAX protease family)
MAAIPLRTTLTLPEAGVVSLLCFGLFTWWSTQAVLAGFPEAQFSESGDYWAIGTELLLGAVALLYLRRLRFDLGSLYPAPDLLGSALGVGIFLLAGIVGSMVTAPFASADQPLMSEFDYQKVSLASTILFSMVNGAFEEVFLLGVLVRGLRHHGLSIAVGLPLLVRVLYHLYQGPLGAVWILVFGLVFTACYLRLGRLWPLVLAHTLWDIVPVAMH